MVLGDVNPWCIIIADSKVWEVYIFIAILFSKLSRDRKACTVTQLALSKCNLYYGNENKYECLLDKTWTQYTTRKLLRLKVTPDLHLTYSKNGGNLGLVLKMKNIDCISILLTKHVKYTYLYLFKFVLYSIVAFKAN